MSWYWIIFFGSIIASAIISYIFNRRFEKYSEVAIPMTGKEIAEKMLRESGIDDVKVTCIAGQLTDHYNPVDKTVNLSPDVYSSASVAAAAVAAHECGHAVQHQTEYAPLQMRSALVPVVTFANKWAMWVIIAGMVIFEIFPQLLWIGIGLYGLTTLFSFVTLPVEIDASRRAIAWLNEAGIVNHETSDMASGALRAAAYTYVIAALSSLAYLLYLIGGASKR